MSSNAHGIPKNISTEHDPKVGSVHEYEGFSIHRYLYLHGMINTITHSQSMTQIQNNEKLCIWKQKMKEDRKSGLPNCTFV